MNFTREIPPLEPEIIFSLFGIPFSNGTLMIFIIMILLIISGIRFRKNISETPSKFQLGFEMMYEYTLDLVSNITGSKKHTDKIFPIIGALFVYLIVANLIGLIPGVASFTLDGTAILKSPTKEFNTTFGLALAAVVTINILAIKERGLFGYLGQFFQFKKVWNGFRKGFTQGFIALIEFFVGLLDIVGEITKVISLSLRLFGNMYAGTVLMIILIGSFAYVIPTVWLGMNLFVGVLQALVFSALVAAYYGLSVVTEEDKN